MRYLLALLAVVLAGCTSETVFHSPDGKQMVICKGEGYRNCRDTALKAGFIEGAPVVRPVGPPALR